MSNDFDNGRHALHEGLAARQRGALDEAVQNYETALGFFEAAEHRGAAIVALNNLGAVAQLRGDPQTAATYYRDGLARAEADEDHAAMALSSGNLGALHLDTGDYVRTRTHAARALQLYAVVGDSAGRGNQLGNLGIIAQQTGERDTANTYFRDAIEAFLCAENPNGAGRVLLRFGEMAREDGDNERAQDAFQRAGDLLARGGDRAGLAYVLRCLGQLSLRTGRTTDAQEYFEKGRDLHVAMGDRRGESAALVDIANLRDMLGEPVDALALRRKALELARTTGSRDAIASALLAVATGLSDLGQTTDSRDTVDEALTLYEALENPRGIAASLVSRAAISRILGHLASGESDLDRAERILSDNDSYRPDMAVLTAGRAGACELRGDVPAARAMLTRAQNLYATVGMASGVHQAALVALQLEGYREPHRSLAQVLTDPRLSNARAFYRSTHNRGGQWTVGQVEATIRRCHGDLPGAADIYESLAQTATEEGRTLDATTVGYSAVEARVRMGVSVERRRLLGLLEGVPDAELVRIRIRCLLCEAAILDDDLDTAASDLLSAQEAIETCGDGYHSGTTLALDAACRLAMARGEVDLARKLGDEAIDRYESTEDHLGAQELRTELS